MKYKLHKLMAMFVASIFAVGAFAADIDVTSKVGTSLDAWTCENGKKNTVTIDDIVMVENYQDGATNTSAETTGVVLWQNVTGLENGSYTVELWANARVAWQASPATDGQEELTYLVANNVEISMKVFLNPGLNSNATYVLEGVEVTDGTLHIEMNKKAAGSNWHSIQIKSLTYHASDDAALAIAKADLQAALDAANAVSPASDEFKAAIASAQNVYDNSQDVEEVKATIESLVKATKDARMANASLDNPVLTDFVVNGTFDTTTAPWQTTTNAQNKALASNQQGAFTGNFFENWNPSAVTGKIYQVIENIPNGTYELSICAFVSVFDASAQFVYANADKVPLITGAPTAYTVRTKVTNNTIEIGFEQTVAKAEWMGIDNVSLTYLGNVDVLALYNKTKAEAEPLLDKKMNADAFAGLKAALEVAVDESSSDEDIEAATASISTAMADAKASIAFFAANKTAIDGMFSLMESTNVYTAEAFLAYKSIADDYLAQYEAGTLTATVDNPAAVHGWHAEVAYDDMLLSAFGTNNFDTNLYINTWSGEGETDGSNFKVPFFEYWIGDGERLGATTKTATVTGLVPGQLYSAEAWVRVRATNGVAAADATGITLSVGDGEAVDITEGEVIGASQFSHGVFTAYGVADAEGNLTINFNVLDGNNVSWLAFKNLKYAPVFPERSTAEAPKYYTIASYNRGGVLTDVDGTVKHIDVNENSYWYFVKADANGGVHVCNLNGKYLTADKGAGDTPAVWYILPNGVNEEGMVISKTNPISDKSCIDANSYDAGLGDWAPNANDWNGTTWVFAAVDYVKDIETLLEANANNHNEVPALGQYATKGYEALAVAKDVVSNPAEALAAIKNFEKAKNLPMFTIDGAGADASGKSIYDDNSGTLYFKATDATDHSMLWVFDMTADEVTVTDKVVVTNVATGNHFWGANFIKVTETNPANAEDGQFLFYTNGTGSPVHAQGNGQKVVRWDAFEAGSGSAWKFTFVAGTYSRYDLSEVYPAFEAQAMEFMAFGEGNMALYQLQALKSEYDEVMMSVQELYGQIYAGAMVLKADVVAAMELMTTTKAKVESVAAYYSEDYNAAWFDANAVLDLIGEEAEEYDALVEATNVATVTTVAELEAKVAVIEAVVAELCGIEEVYPAFEEKLMELMSVGEGNMALYRLSAVQAQVVEVMTAANEIYGVVSEGGLVLKSEVVAVTELMDETLAEVKPVLAYYSEAYNAAWFDANAVLDLIGEEAEEYDALVEATNVATVTTAAELEEKVAVIAPIVAKYCGIEDVYPAFEAKLMELMSVGEGNMALYSLSAVQAQVVEVMTAANEIYGIVSEGGLVLRTEVVAMTELMDATLAEVNPVLAYYTETYSDIYWSANDLLESLDPESIEWATLDDAINQVYDLSEVTTVAELEAKVAILKAAMDEITVTGINGIDAGANAVIYDLSGRRVEKAVKGIYIVNGKKVLVK